MVKDWENTTIGNLFTFKNGLNKSKEFFGQGTPIVNYMDVYKNRGIHAEQILGRVTLSTEEINRFDVQKGDVFFTRTSETPEEVGYSSVMLDDITDCVFSGFVLRGRPITDKLDILFCQYVFMNETIRKAIISSCTYTTRALTNGTQLSAIEIQLPDKSEQHRIAETLSDTDELITTLEKLIAKKRTIKQGAMQELLTGKRRLPGFSGEWVEKKVSDFGVIVTGATPSTSVAEYWNGNIPWVTPTDISVSKDIFITERMITEYGLSVIRELPANTLLITCIASIGKNTILRSIGASNQQINAIIPKADYNVDFLYYLFEINKTYLLGKAGQTATSIISKQDFSEFIFTVPCNLPEQTAIASILSDMDAEIDVLTAKLNKFRNIKQGMMSELLTGRIRLLEQEMR